MPVLTQADLPTLCALKTVSRSWRARARRVLWARLCKCEGQALPRLRADVTGLNIEPCLGAGVQGLAHVIDARALFPNLSRLLTNSHEVDMVAVGLLEPTAEYDPEAEPRIDALGPARGCTSGDGEPPVGLVLAI